MFSQEIELRGHIIDSLNLPKVLDEILSHGGSFKRRHIQVGQQRTDPSHARVELSGPSPEAVDELIGRLRQHGAEMVVESDALLVEAPANARAKRHFLNSGLTSGATRSRARRNR
jgi:hypothetical protein